jgi:hypothetical protein
MQPAATSPAAGPEFHDPEDLWPPERPRINVIMELRAESAREPPNSGSRAPFEPPSRAQLRLLPLPACTTLTVSKFTDVAEHPVVLYATYIGVVWLGG